MRRLRFLLACLSVVLSLGVAEIAHARENPVSVEVSTAQMVDHSDGDGDQVPADSDKAYPHHHNTCHDHLVGVPVTSDRIVVANLPPVRAIAWSEAKMAGAPTDPALRPPQA